MKKIALILVSGLLFGLHAKADVLANYSFNASSRASFDTDLNTAASALTDGAGWTSSIDIARGNPTPSVSVDSAQTDGLTQGAAVAANDYYTFTISPGGGVTMNLATLSFDFANYTNSGVFPTENFFVRSSVDGFTANLAVPVTATVASAGVFGHTDIPLTGPAFQNATAPIEFRLYIFDGTTSVAKGALVDNIVLQGTSAIPEPSVYMLLGVGLLFCGQRFMRRKSA